MVMRTVQSFRMLLGLRWARWESALARRLHGTPRRQRGLGFLAPAIVLGSLLLWSLASVESLPPSPELMRELTPWVGAVALLLESLWLLRMAGRLSALCHAHADRFGGPQRIREVRRALLPVLNFLLGVLAFSGFFYYFALDAITEQARLPTVRLLWYLTVGGLAVAIVIGELIDRFLNVVEDMMIMPPAPGPDGATGSPPDLP